MAQEAVSIPGVQGQILSGVIDRPAGEARAWAVFAHCFTCGKSLPAAQTIASTLASRGVGVLRFDFTGLGESEGDFSATNFSSGIDDLVAAAQWLAEHEEAPALLIGHSLGGAAVLAAAARLPHVVAIATIGAPSDPSHVAKLFADHATQIASEGAVKVTLAGRPFTIKRQLLEDLSAANLEPAVRSVGKALLVLHAPLDMTVGIENASALFGWAKHPKSFLSLDGADHLLKRREDAEYAADMILSWANHYLPAFHGDARSPEWVHVSEAGSGPFKQSIAAGRHHLIADEPRAQGGTDAGPSPYQLLLAALGACTAMTIRMYADRKKIGLAHVSVDLRPKREHGKDLAAADAAPAHLDHIERVVTLAGVADDNTRQRLMEIAEKCPVHRTLSNTVEITTREVR